MHRKPTQFEPPKLEKRQLLALPDVPSWRDRPAWAMSLIFHVIVIVLLAIVWKPVMHGTGGEPDRPVGIAVVHQSSSGQEYFLPESDSASGASGGQASLSTNNAASSSAAASALPTGAGPPMAVSELLQGLLPGGESPSGNPGDATGAMGLGTGNAKIGGSGNIKKAKTTVFGVEGTGSRFVYVFDRSDSMNGYGGRPLAIAKQELTKSLDSLDTVHQFQIVFYNENPTVFRAPGDEVPRMYNGQDRNKQNAEAFVNNITGFGGTGHAEALKQALSLNPDCVFFLTDAKDPALGAGDLASVQRKAERTGATIHCIEFGTGPLQGDGGWIEVLAKSTGGKYRYVDVAKL